MFKKYTPALFLIVLYLFVLFFFGHVDEMRIIMLPFVLFVIPMAGMVKR